MNPLYLRAACIGLLYGCALFLVRNAPALAAGLLAFLDNVE